MQFAAACALLVASWLLLRRQAGSGTPALNPLSIISRNAPASRDKDDAPARSPKQASVAQATKACLDIAPIVLGWLLLLSLTARPVMAATAIAAIAAGLAMTDSVKRATLREPLVFADRAELLEVVRHPRLYLPFAGPVKVVGGALLALALVGALIWLEPAAPRPSPLLMLPLVLACVLLPTWPPLLHRLAACYRRFGLTDDPARDMRRTGFLACLIIHATIARAERPHRRAAIPPFAPLPPPQARMPVVLVQIESFFDARRLGPAIPAGLLPGYDRLLAGAAQAGRLAVPCWGANTVRTEFAVLTGIGQTALGLDRFNPYERFAQARLRSLAWEMKRAGYRTICLHPFDKRFYARSAVMPQLGFDEFRGLEAFEGAPHAGPYVTDLAVAQAIIRILHEEGPAVFVFAMTMGNHGPWTANGPHPPLPGWAAALDHLPESEGLRGYLAGLVAGDAMLAPLLDALPPGGTLAVYGDHQPSLPAAFAALGVPDETTDYAIWHAGQPPGTPPGTRPDLHHDIRAEDLAALLLHQRARMDSTAPGLR